MLKCRLEEETAKILVDPLSKILEWVEVRPTPPHQPHPLLYTPEKPENYAPWKIVFLYIHIYTYYTNQWFSGFILVL